jgi:hypothetical protein
VFFWKNHVDTRHNQRSNRPPTATDHRPHAHPDGPPPTTHHPVIATQDASSHDVASPPPHWLWLPSIRHQNPPATKLISSRATVAIVNIAMIYNQCLSSTHHPATTSNMWGSRSLSSIGCGCCLRPAHIPAVSHHPSMNSVSCTSREE